MLNISSYKKLKQLGKIKSISKEETDPDRVAIVAMLFDTIDGVLREETIWTSVGFLKTRLSALTENHALVQSEIDNISSLLEDIKGDLKVVHLEDSHGT